MTVTPSSPDLERMSPEELRTANLITLLLLCAKTLQVTVPNCGLDVSEEKRHEAGNHLASFVYQLSSNYGDGKSLEADTIALAKKIGFNVEQRYLSPEAHA